MVESKHLGGDPIPGNVIWVKHCGSWWPAVVVNEDAVSITSKPDTRSNGDVLVRLYGSCQHVYVDPTKLRSEFESMLKENSGCYRAILLNSLEQARAQARSNRSKRQQSKCKGTLSEAVEVSEEENPNRVNQKRKSNNKSTSSGNALCNARDTGAKSKLSKQPSVKNHKRKCPSTDEGEKSMASLREEVPKEDQVQTPKYGTGVLGGSEELSGRRRKVMQTLGLIAPYGSPFGKDVCLLSEPLM